MSTRCELKLLNQIPDVQNAASDFRCLTPLRYRLHIPAGASRGPWTFTVTVSPRVYVSWWREEDGDLLMPRNAANIKRPTPIHYVVGSRDALTRPREEIFAKAPPHPLSKYTVVDAGHFDAPEKAIPVVLQWLGKLAAASVP